jgi:hydrogenase expression/formation protein HypE
MVLLGTSLATNPFFPVGKLPADVLGRLLAHAPVLDERVVLGPGIGLDCAVIDLGERLLVFKSDPITFAVEDIGWYAVQVNANDIATSGATPRWFMITALLPEGRTSESLLTTISEQVFSACRDLGISVIGGHTEITHGLERPILVGTLVGEVARGGLVTPRGASPGNKILLTKGVPVEATAILAREFPARLRPDLNEAEIVEAANFLYHPGISIVKDVRIAQKAGKVTAMHDPTEGGLASALWELAEASGHCLVVQPENVPVPALAAKICRVFGLDPLATIASGALLLTCAATHAPAICQALEAEGIPARVIGQVEEGPAAVWQTSLDDSTNPAGRQVFPRPERDEIGKVYQND